MKGMKLMSELSAEQRLKNICAALEEQADESPFTREEWDRVDKETVRLQNRVKELEAQVAAFPVSPCWCPYCGEPHGLGSTMHEVKSQANPGVEQ